MAYHWSPNENKCPQVSRTLLSILADLNTAAIWIVSTRPLISKSSSPFNNPSITVPRAPITIGINVTFMFHSFFQFSSKIQELIFLFFFFQFCSVVSQDSKVHNSASSIYLSIYLLLTITRSGRLAGMRWSVCISKSEEFLRLILPDKFWVVHKPFVRMVKFELLAQFQVDHLLCPVVSILIHFLC